MINCCAVIITIMTINKHINQLKVNILKYNLLSKPGHRVTDGLQTVRLQHADREPGSWHMTPGGAAF